MSSIISSIGEAGGHRAPHRVHDWKTIRARIRAVAPRRTRLERLQWEMGAEEIYALVRPARGGAPTVYFSAGIHGDEPASTEALLRWLEGPIDRWTDMGIIAFPCLNPWGIQRNMRFDANGADLNRLFHRKRHPLVEAVRSQLAQHQIDLALLLHEDYDGQGYYVYETVRGAGWGAALIDAAGAHIAPEGRSRIDGARHRSGVIRRRIRPELFEQMGLPEAVALFIDYTARVYTIESPSEFGIEQRVAAHLAVVEAALRLAHEPKSTNTQPGPTERGSPRVGRPRVGNPGRRQQS